jgi:hypothetical protein
MKEVFVITLKKDGEVKFFNPFVFAEKRGADRYIALWSNIFGRPLPEYGVATMTLEEGEVSEDWVDTIKVAGQDEKIIRVQSRL